MKYTITYQYLDSTSDYTMKKITPRSWISGVTGLINEKYLTYYIEEIEKVKNGLKESMRIYTSDEIEQDDIIEWIEVYREKSKSENGNEEIETEELLEFLKLMKKELGIGDEVVVDKRCVDF